MSLFSRDEWEADNALNNYDWSLPVDADIMDICDGDCVGCWYDCFPDFEFWQIVGHWKHEENLKNFLKWLTQKKLDNNIQNTGEKSGKKKS